MESINVNLTIDKAYHHLINFISSLPKSKVERCLEPSFIKVKKTEYSRSLTPFYVNIKLHRKEEGVSIEFDFDFSMQYTVNIILSMIFFIGTIPVAILLNTFTPPVLFLVFVVTIFLMMPEKIRKQKEKFLERVTEYFKDADVKVYKEL